MIVTCHSPTRDSTVIGTKAANLVLLQELDLNVPKWFVVTGSYLHSLLPKTLLVAKDFQQTKKFILNYSFPENFSAVLEEAIKELSLENSKLAVRSSSVDEDTQGFSYAGMYSSFLNIDIHRLEEYIKKVWASAYSSRVATYVASNNIEDFEPSISVLIQQLIKADVSGVAFGINPVSQNPQEKIICATFGMGEGVVGGNVPTDTFTIRPGEIERVIEDKTSAVFCNSDQGTDIGKVPEDQRKSTTLSDQQLHQLAEIADRLQIKTGTFQDIEFSFAKDRLYLLQTRPVTTGQAAVEETIWDNNNIIESYPGITSPLTFSFVRRTYQIGYQQLSELLGIGPKTIEANSTLYENMLGLIRGRVYYNLTNIRKILCLLPGAQYTTKYLDGALGIPGGDSETIKTKAMGYGSIAWAGLHLVYQFARLKNFRIRFCDYLESKLEQLKTVDFAGLSAPELVALYHRLERDILGQWKAPVLNGFIAMIFFGLLKRLTRRWNLDKDRNNIFNELISGQGNIVSTEPIKELIVIANHIQNNSRWQKLFSQVDNNKILERLRAPEFKPLEGKIKNYLSKYGQRCVGGELKFENPTYQQKPELFIKVIKSYLGEVPPLSFDSESTNLIRKQSEREIAKCLEGKIVKRVFYSWLLNKTREMVMWRENFRFMRTRVFGIARSIFIELGNIFYRQSVIEAPEDIFFLTKEEIFSYIEGRSFSSDLSQIVASRRRDDDIYQKETLPERIIMSGIPGKWHPQESTLAANNKHMIQGIGCSPGIVKRKVRLIHSPDELDNLGGDILVALSTDPGWVKFFPTASGIVIERGSLLSHTGIVTREMGIPCVVGARGIISAVQTGDLIEMNGSTGEVKIIARAS
jgi:pyruvate,water dikinase